MLKDRRFFINQGKGLNTHLIRILTIAEEMTAKVSHAQVQLMTYHVEGRGKSLEATMHARLGHPGKTLTRKLVKSTRGGPNKWKGEEPCKDDVLGKPCAPCALAKFD